MKKQISFAGISLFLFVGLLSAVQLNLAAAPSATPLFSNQTAATGTTLTHNTPVTSGDGAKMISGGAAGDFDNDGYQDLFIIGGGDGQADALFINQQDGTFLDMASTAGIGDPHIGSGAAVGDYNNDGWLDIYVTSFGTMADGMAIGRHRLYRNDTGITAGNAISFTEVAVAAGVNQTTAEHVDGLGSAFGDYDLDGDLDLFVAGWRKIDGEGALGNRLFRNNGDGTFTDVTDTTGIYDYGVRGFGPCFVDMDGDRYPELLLAADFGTTQYYINDTDGTFTEYTQGSGTDKAWSGMGQTIGDFNNDGRFDWFETAIFEDPGDGFGRGDGNKLYINQGNNTFAETAAAAGVDDGGWGWGTVAVDFDHDGWQDLAMVNGWVFEDQEGDPIDYNPYMDERGYVWLNNGDATFTEVGLTVNFDHDIHGMALFNFDYDNDGDQDMAATAYNDAFNLYRSELSGEDTNWLRIFLDNGAQTDVAPNGFGSRVSITIGEETQYRSISGCTHYLSQSELSAHFGVGSATEIDELRVEWPDGSVSTMEDVAVNQTLTLSADDAEQSPTEENHPVFLPFVQQ